MAGDGMRLVLVEWEDSHALTASGWMHLDGEYDTAPRVVLSVGWLLVDDERSKIIVPHRNEETPDTYAQGAGVISIPTRCVVRMVDLYEARTERQAASAA
ncbi:MAG: hypothetical protein WKG32_13190 [Gemmatimonadaceae bacterium]